MEPLCDDVESRDIRDSQDRTFCLSQRETHHGDGIGIGMRKPEKLRMKTSYTGNIESEYEQSNKGGSPTVKKTCVQEKWSVAKGSHTTNIDSFSDMWVATNGNSTIGMDAINSKRSSSSRFELVWFVRQNQYLIIWLIVV